jgi:hypothetical protein
MLKRSLSLAETMSCPLGSPIGIEVTPVPLAGSTSFVCQACLAAF